MDEDGNKLPDPQPGVLTPLGPHDGRDSIQLPVTVEPNVDLTDGHLVTASGPGFIPGERVGIVQCASEAGENNGGTREERLGIDGCNVGSVQYANADAEGVATGTINVRRVLTTPATGTVDCALEAQRCIVAMGALDDYDRSGGYGVAFRGGGEPIDIPTVTVSPIEGLADGDLVHVEGEGFTPGPVQLGLCSIDPAGCWTIGNPFRLSAAETRDLGLSDQYGGGEYLGTGLVADPQGRVSGDVQVWRFLPTTEPGSYIDCAVSRCSLRLTSELDGLAPPPPVLGFAPGGTGPVPPAIAATPTRDLQPGDEIVVRGAGFAPGAYYSISLCAAPPGDPVNVFGCVSSDESQHQVDPDGGFAREVEVPDIESFADGGGFSEEGATTTMCATESGCLPTLTESELCDGAHSVCTIRVDAYTGGPDVGPPQFPAVPIPITFR